MTFDEIEELVKKYLATGVAVVVVFAGDGTTNEAGAPSVVTITPEPSTSPSTGPSTTPTSRGKKPDRSEPPVRSGPPSPTAEPEQDHTGAADTDPAAAPSPSGEEGSTAAAKLGWGAPSREETFDADGGDWRLYDGTGHAGKGKRSPAAVSREGGILTITGDAQGTTGGMAWMPGQKYGRWEGRVRAPAADPSYNALLLLWPDADDFPSGGEIDFMEMQDPARRTTKAFVHYGEKNAQVDGSVEVDASTWHNWAVEWGPDAIVTYLDGEEWFRTTDKAIIPSGPMHLCVQLDWFPGDGTAAVKESSMQVDWVRQYPFEPGQAARPEPTRTPQPETTEPGTTESEASDTPETEAPDAEPAEEADDDVSDTVRRIFSWR
ncbi:glycoside hydrolase family 16 protein [Pseudonocardia sp. TRM90224]|uniref:glycoside hydrolase family 16 protein n=1 Tax=Pseudonocardia sp. TRM90224 TaxID=2812678 RepID=UPI001E5CBB12|nr:glycoside hydrolase family 16 protein [Pseudonocardia sp. TRM90224]